MRNTRRPHFRAKNLWHNALKHRPDIDGLRAIAVLLVACFHADFTPLGLRVLPSGFFGVDVFFVISGYLITSLVVKDCRMGRFSFGRFLERRIRRIVPALLVVVAATLPVAWILLSPLQMRDFGASAAAAALFVSNFLFWSQAGYFDQASALKPLLHTWSLGVEMQFYLLFPFFVVTVVQRTRHLAEVFGAAALASFALCLYVSSASVDAAFYLFPTRAWELLAGAAIAVSRLPGENENLKAAAIIVGLLLIVVPSSMTFDADANPGWATVMPVVGTILVINYSSAAIGFGRVLSWAPIATIGLLSYSFYLWHQPILVFQRILSPGSVSEVAKAAALALAIVVSWLTWRLIELPARMHWSKWVVGGAGSTLAAVIMIFGSTATTDGHAARFGPQGVFSLDVARGYFVDDKDCFHQNCLIGSADRKPVLAIKGDSHAGMLATSMNEKLVEAGLAGLTLADGDILVSRFPDFYQGADEQNQLLQSHLQLIDELGIPILVHAGRATLRVYNSGFDNGEGGIEQAERWDTGRTREQQERVLTAIEEGFRDFADTGRHVVIVYPVPEVGWHVPDMLVMRQGNEHAGRLTTSFERYLERNREIIALYDRLSEHQNIETVRTANLFCNIISAGRCETVHFGQVLYSDSNHLSKYGADLLAERILEVIQSLQPKIQSRAY